MSDPKRSVVSYRRLHSRKYKYSAISHTQVTEILRREIYLVNDQ